MPAPKGTRAVPFATSETDAVHIYSNPQHIWLQLRRDVPTDQSIGRASFKVALTLTPEQAIAIAGELLTAASRNISTTATTPTKQPPNNKKAPAKKTSPPKPQPPKQPPDKPPGAK